MKPIRKDLPILFHERFAQIILGVYPDFFDKDFCDDVFAFERIQSFMLTSNLPKEILSKKIAIASFIEFSRSWMDKHTNEAKNIFERIVALLLLRKTEESAVHGDTDINFATFDDIDFAVLLGLGKKEYDALEYDAYCSDLSIKKLTDEFCKSRINSVIEGLLTKEKSQLESFAGVVYDMNVDGNHVFRIEEQLHNELLLTDVSRIDDSFINMPYDVMCIDLPYNKTLICKGKLIKHIYIVIWKSGGGLEMEVSCIMEKDGDVGISVTKFSFSGGDIMKQIDEQIDVLWEGKLIKKENRNIISYIISFLLYINSTSADVVMVTPFKNKIPKENTKYPVCSVGSSIIINKSLHSRSDSDSEEAKEYNRYILKWSVRGHYRQQACGAGRKKHELIWIRPFLKGHEKNNEEINAKPTNYVVK